MHVVLTCRNEGNESEETAAAPEDKARQSNESAVGGDEAAGAAAGGLRRRRGRLHVDHLASLDYPYDGLPGLQLRVLAGVLTRVLLRRVLPWQLTVLPHRDLQLIVLAGVLLRWCLVHPRLGLGKN